MSGKSTRPYIVFCGSSSTGKTTIAKLIKKFCDEYFEASCILLDGVPRRVTTGKLNEDGDENVQYEIEKMFQDEESKYETTPILATRSVLDRYAYTKANDLKGKVIDFYKELVPSCLNKYTILFYLPIEERVALEDNGYRSLDSMYREQVDFEIQQLLKEYKSVLPLTVTLTGPVRDRVKIVINTIKELYRRQDD